MNAQRLRDTSWMADAACRKLTIAMWARRKEEANAARRARRAELAEMEGTG